MTMPPLRTMFTDGKFYSWTRVMATPIIIAGIFSFIYSIIIKYGDGLLYSTGLVGLGLGIKGYQTNQETKQLNIQPTNEEILNEEGK